MRGTAAGTWRHRAERGTALFASVLVLALTLSAGLAALLKWSLGGYRAAINRTERNRMLYAAEAGLQFSVGYFRSLETQLQTTHGSMGTWNSYCADLSNTFVAGVAPLLPQGLVCVTYEALAVSKRLITVRSAVSNTHDGSVLEVRHSITNSFISPFEHLVFYGVDLEIHPGAHMTLCGPVRCNNALYLGTCASLKFKSLVRIGGEIWHRVKVKNKKLDAGPIYFTDADGDYQPMAVLDDWLDNSHPHWLVGSQILWSGNVKSKDHGVTPLLLSMPVTVTNHLGQVQRMLVATTNAHILIEPPASSNDTYGAKYYNKAGMRILEDGTVQGVSNAVITAYGGTTNVDHDYVIGHATNMSWIVTTNRFWNTREQTYIRPLDIDIAKLDTWLASCALPLELTRTNSARFGVLYVTTTNAPGRAVRLANGARLPDTLRNRLTVASPRPVYVLGNFNTELKINGKVTSGTNAPASIVSDAFTVLSKNWRDKDNQFNNMERAKQTEVNAAIMTGIVPTVDALYSGGLENYPRFLEDWKGVKFTFRGSMVCLWHSVYETGSWQPTGIYYEAPNREWEHESQFNDPGGQPPGTVPYLRFSVVPGSWRRTR